MQQRTWCALDCVYLGGKILAPRSPIAGTFHTKAWRIGPWSPARRIHQCQLLPPRGPKIRSTDAPASTHPPRAPRSVHNRGDHKHTHPRGCPPRSQPIQGGEGNRTHASKVGPPLGVPLDPAGIQQRGEGNRTNRVGKTQWLSVPLAPPPFSSGRRRRGIAPTRGL